MRYRALDANGDYSFGQGAANFLVNSPAAVAQLVQTRLLLFLGEFFLDTSDGTPYYTQILGTGTQQTYDLAVQDRILSTQGVIGIASYQSIRDPNLRTLSVVATIDTIYGQTQPTTFSTATTIG